MKMPRARRIPLIGVMLASMCAFSAAVDKVSVTESGVEFTVLLYKGTYRLKFRQDGTRSFYTFNSATQVTNIEVGPEMYNILYDTSNDLESVELAPSDRRALGRVDDDATRTAFEGRRLVFEDCAACEEAWDASCASASSVCDLVRFGSPFSAEAAASIDTTCETFGSACLSHNAVEACQGQCTNEVPAEVNSCLDPTSEEYQCSFSGDTSINFRGCDLTDSDAFLLPGCFEDFGKTNLQSLNLGSSFLLTTLPERTFAGLSELTTLNLFQNVFRTVPEGLFYGLTKLESLDLGFNGLISLPEGVFSGLASLEILLIVNNELTPETLPIGLFSGLSSLQELDLSRNLLEDMTGLEGLFDGLTELTFLGLEECLIEIIPEGLFAGLAKLEELNLSRNGLSSLPDGLLSGLPLSRRLDLSQNLLTDLGTSLAGLTELGSLSLNDNRLVTVTEGMFDGLVNLRLLGMGDNGLVSVAEGAFSDLAGLQILHLSDNELTAQDLPIGLFSGVPQLQSLRMGRNPLEDLTRLEGLFDGLTELTTLRFDQCGINTIPEGLLTGLTKLEFLDLRENSLSFVPGGLLSGLTMLQTLRLDDNSLFSLPAGLLSATTDLRSLDLFGNNLTDIGTSLAGLTELGFLDLGNNNLLLTEDSFSDLVNMGRLVLNGCGLTTLPAGLFSPMVNLDELELRENRDLQCLPSTASTDVDIDRDIEEDVLGGTCECTPAEAVFCDDGLFCQRGMTGYTCVV